MKRDGNTHHENVAIFIDVKVSFKGKYNVVDASLLVHSSPKLFYFRLSNHYIINFSFVEICICGHKDWKEPFVKKITRKKTTRY